MSYKILEMNGVDNENIDGAALNNFAASGRNGIMKGVLDECRIFSASDTSITLSTGEFIIQGFRIKILSPQTYQLTPRVPSETYYGILRLTLSTDRSVSCSIEFRAREPYKKDNLFAQEFGEYEVQLVKFTLGLSVENLGGFLPVITSDSATTEAVGIMAEEALSKASTAESASEEALVKSDRALAMITDAVGGEITLSAYPVGSIYMSINSTSPAVLFGGTWEKIEGRFLMGSGTALDNNKNDFGDLNNANYIFTSGDMGGQYRHKLTINEMPSHNHQLCRPRWYTTDGKDRYTAFGGTAEVNEALDNFAVRSTGGDTAHHILNPYYVVNIWKRIA